MSYLHRAGVGGLILGTTLALTGPARAQSSHDLAQQVLTQANADLTAAQQRTETVRDLSDATRARLADLSGRSDGERVAARDLRDRLTRAQSAVSEIQAKIDSAAARQSARRKEMAVEDLKYGPLKFADDQARLDAIHDFESSAPYRTALAAAADRASAVRALEAKFSDDQRRLAADPNVLIARQRLADAKKGVDELRQRFVEEQLPRIQKVKFADEAVGAEQAHYDEISAAAKAAEADGAAAAAIMDRQKAGLAADHATLDRMTAELAQLDTQIASVRADVDRADKSLQIALAYVTASEQSQANAQAALDQIDGPATYFAAPTVYSYYAPPSIVYVQPSPVYVGGSYYGGIVFGPARGPVFGFNPNRGDFGNRFDPHPTHFHGNNNGGRMR